MMPGVLMHIKGRPLLLNTMGISFASYFFLALHERGYAEEPRYKP